MSEQTGTGRLGDLIGILGIVVVSFVIMGMPGRVVGMFVLTGEKSTGEVIGLVVVTNHAMVVGMLGVIIMGLKTSNKYIIGLFT